MGQILDQERPGSEKLATSAAEALPNPLPLRGHVSLDYWSATLK